MQEKIAYVTMELEGCTVRVAYHASDGEQMQPLLLGDLLTRQFKLLVSTVEEGR